MKKCGSCNSTRITVNDLGEITCQRCGYHHSDIKKPVFVTYGGEDGAG